MLFHGHSVLCPAPLSANHAKVCEAHLGSNGHCHKHPPWTNNTCSFQKRWLFYLYCFFSIMKDRVKQNLIFLQRMENFKLSQSLKIYLSGRKKQNLSEKGELSLGPSTEPKQKRRPTEISTLNFFEILKLHKSQKALYKSVVSAYLCQFHTYHDLADYLYSKARLSKGLTFLDGLFKGFIALCISKEAYILYI